MFARMARSTRTPVIAPDTQYRSVLVVIDPVRQPTDSLRDAVALALEHRAVLTILGLVREPPSAAVQAGYPLARLRRDALEDAADQLRELARSLPVEISIRTVVRCGKPHTQLRNFLRDGYYDAVFVRGPGMHRLHRRRGTSGPAWDRLRRAQGGSRKAWL